LDAVADVTLERVSFVRTRRRRQNRAKPLTLVDGRTVASKRIIELRALFMAAMGDVEVSPLRALQVEQAAASTALAEMVRGRFMRNGSIPLDEVIRAERRSDTLVKRLGLPVEGAQRHEPPTLSEYMQRRPADAVATLAEAPAATIPKKQPMRATGRPWALVRLLP
jgi:hypothetical protein